MLGFDYNPPSLISVICFHMHIYFYTYYHLYQDLQFCEGLGKDKYCVSTGFVAMLTTVTVSFLLKYFNKAEFMAA